MKNFRFSYKGNQEVNVKLEELGTYLKASGYLPIGHTKEELQIEYDNHINSLMVSNLEAKEDWEDNLPSLSSFKEDLSKGFEANNSY